MTAAAPNARPSADAPRRPVRLGFLGVGWIGRHRMQAMLDTGAVEAAAIAEPSPEAAAQARAVAPLADQVGSLEALLSLDLDGVVIATPSAMHAAQSIQALRRGLAVFCQKPLGRTAVETRAVIDAARAADRLLGVDLSYRETQAMGRIRDLIRTGALGEVFAVDLVFHNAYGPDKAWFYDPALSGGGCVIDLGVHLVDLALWLLDFPPVGGVSARLFAGGRPLGEAGGAVEDYAVAEIEVGGGVIVRLACSWNLHAGRDAVIGVEVHGAQGGAAMRNLNGSFYDFAAERFRGSSREALVSGADDWGGRAAAAWARRLAGSAGFDPAIARLVEVAAVLDRIYGRA